MNDYDSYISAAPSAFGKEGATRTSMDCLGTTFRKKELYQQ